MQDKLNTETAKAVRAADLLLGSQIPTRHNADEAIGSNPIYRKVLAQIGQSASHLEVAGSNPAYLLKRHDGSSVRLEHQGLYLGEYSGR